ncbi:sigma-70 family RNA polymerase sigma factor [bacterium]|nr:sigma-70 family RNA polymerase sigma factor [bacterium]
MPEAPLTRVSLLLRIRDPADIEAWGQFVQLYGPVLYGWYRNRGLQDADACDLTQEVLQGVSQGAARLDYDPARGTFRSWLFTIARRRLHDFFTKRGRLPGSVEDTSQFDSLAVQPNADEEAQWERSYQQQLFALAAEHVQTCVDRSTWQTAVAGLPAQKVAESLGMSIGNVYVAKSRVMTRLKQWIEQVQGDE